VVDLDARIGRCAIGEFDVNASFKRLFLCVFWAWCLACPCRASADPATQHLIHASGLDGIAMLSMPRSLYPRAPATDPDLREAMDCVDATKGAGYAGILADAAEMTMSPAELRDAQRFFDSPLGIKYRALRIWQALADLGLPEDLPVPSFSKQEEEEAAAFVTSPAGTSLSVAKLLEVPQMIGRMYELTINIVAPCVKRSTR
jgi:hypothetical protein